MHSIASTYTRTYAVKESCLLIVFAKAPKPGKVKTRLIPAYGEQGAAKIHKQLVQRVVQQACATPLVDVELHTALTSRHPFFWQLRREYNLTLKSQVAGDLGKKMQMAIRHGLKTHERVLIVGTDWAAFDVGIVSAAALALSKQDFVFVPAEDGGYVLIGASKDNNAPFRGIEWGTDKVMSKTEQHLRRQALPYGLLPMSWDVDHPEDVQRAVAAGLIDGVPPIQEITGTSTKLPQHYANLRTRIQNQSKSTTRTLK